MGESGKEVLILVKKGGWEFVSGVPRHGDERTIGEAGDGVFIVKWNTVV